MDHRATLKSLEKNCFQESSNDIALNANWKPSGGHRLEDPLHRPRAGVVEEEHEADKWKNQLT